MSAVTAVPITSELVSNERRHIIGKRPINPSFGAGLAGRILVS